MMIILFAREQTLSRLFTPRSNTIHEPHAKQNTLTRVNSVLPTVTRSDNALTLTLALLSPRDFPFSPSVRFVPFGRPRRRKHNGRSRGRGQKKETRSMGSSIRSLFAFVTFGLTTRAWHIGRRTRGRPFCHDFSPRELVWREEYQMLFPMELLSDSSVTVCM